LMLQDQLLLIPFVFFFVQALIFFSIVPSSFSTMAFTTSPPSTTTWATGVWGLGFFSDVWVFLGYIWWFFSSNFLPMLSLLVSIFTIPLSLMVAYPGLMIIELPALIVFSIGILLKMGPILSAIGTVIGQIIQAILGMIP